MYTSPYVISGRAANMDKDHKITGYLIPVCIVISTLFTPYAVQEYRTMIFAHGFIWYFPFWRFYHGYDEIGTFAFIRTFGMGFPFVQLEPLITGVILGTGMVLAGIMRVVVNDNNKYSMELASVIAALIIEIGMPILATLTMETNMAPAFLTGLVPVPIPAILAIIGLVYIHRGRVDSHSF